MTNVQENKSAMYKGVHTFLGNNSNIVSAIPELENSKTELGVKLNSIIAKDKQRDSVLTGKTQNKADARNALIEMTMKVSGAVLALGKKTRNNELVETGSVTRSDLKRLRDTKVLAVIENQKDKAGENAAALAGFGVSAADLAEFDSLYTTYTSVLGQKESASGTKTGATGALTSLYKQTDDLLIIIDGIVQGLKKEQPEFYSGYNANRVIKDLGKGRRTRKGTVSLNETINIFSLGIEDSTSFKIKNTGKTQLRFFASDSELPVSEGGITVDAGNEITATTLELGNPGSDHLNVTNLSTSKRGEWKVKKNS